MASKIELLRAVAASVGARVPTDENENTAFLKQILPIYESVTLDFSTRHAWSWGTATREITATSETAPLPWLYVYALPVDRTLIRDVTDANGLPVDYDIEGQKLFCKLEGPLKAKINTAVNEAYWPGDFAKCVQTTLEGYSWKGLREEYAKGQQLIEDVDPPQGVGLLQKAISRDKRQKPPMRPIRGTVYSAYRNLLTRRRPLDG